MRKFCAIFLVLVMGCHEHEHDSDAELSADEEMFDIDIGWHECIPLCPTKTCPTWEVCVGYTPEGMPLTQGWDVGMGLILWCFGEDCAEVATMAINACGVCAYE